MQSNNRVIEKSKNARKGFTLIEMLVVIGIIAILIGASMASFSKMLKTADSTKAQELVSEAATALTAIYNADGIWPKLIREANQSKDKGILGNESGNEIAYILAKRGFMSLSIRDGKLAGNDRFGVLTPWAAKIVARKGDKASLSDVEGQILNFAVDLNGDGKITSAECGNRTGATEIRATAVVWCPSKDGKSQIQSWTKGQAQEVR